MTLNRIAHYESHIQAVSSTIGRATLWVGYDNTYRSSLVMWKGKDHQDIYTTTLNEFVRTHRWPDMIKVDVEGAEMMVLEGATDLLADTSSIIWIIEVHNNELDDKIHEMLATYRYRVASLSLDEATFKPYPKHIIAYKNDA